MSEELRLRIQSGIVMAIGVLFATWMGGIVFRLLAAAIALLVFYEWSTITRLKETHRTAFVLAWMAQAMIAAAVVLGFLSFASALLLAFTLLAIAFVARRNGSGWLPGGIVYAGLTGISLAAIRGADMTGLKAMLVVFAVVWGTDILAYFVGRRLRGPKLAPRISPGKTWSGAIGGTIAGVACGLVVVALAGGHVGVGIALLLLVLSVFSQIGDLFESFIKRRFGVKDSSRLIPGHGGVMDRVDGLVFACFAAYLLAAAVHTLSSCTQCSAGSLLLGGTPF
jgi:phosphatidate cytidylyltransferase